MVLVRSYLDLKLLFEVSKVLLMQLIGSKSLAPPCAVRNAAVTRQAAARILGPAGSTMGKETEVSSHVAAPACSGNDKGPNGPNQPTDDEE